MNLPGNVALVGVGSASNSDLSAATIAELAATLTSRLNQELRSCMAEKGFPQLLQAAEGGTTQPAESSHEPLRLGPLEFGPYTAAQAEKYGLLGTVHAFNGDEPRLQVLSRNPGFDEELAQCRQAFSDAAGTDVDALQADLAELQDAMRVELVTATEPHIYGLLVERLECLRSHGYPALEPDVVLSTDSFEDTLHLLGIPPGNLRSSSPPAASVAPGEVAVVALPPAPQYVPSEEEIAFALSYVDCGVAVDFVARLEDIQMAARQEILASHEAELSGVALSLRAAFDGLASGS